MRRLIPHPDGQGGLRQEHMLGSRDAHKGKVIGHIRALFVLAPHNQVLEQAVACETFRTGGVPAFVQVI